MKLNKFFISSFILYSSLLAQNINYATSDIQTLTLPKQASTINLEYLLMNDTVDVLRIKESETVTNAALSAMGDLKGYGAKIRYGITSNLMLHMSIEKFGIDVYDSKLINRREDIFLRYNLFNHPFAKLNSGVSLDVGYVTNRLEDVSIDGFSQLDAQKNSTISQIDDATNSVDNSLSDLNSIKSTLIGNGLNSNETFTSGNFENYDGIGSIQNFPSDFLKAGYYIFPTPSSAIEITNTQYDDAMKFIDNIGYINVDEIEKDLIDTKKLLQQSKQELIDASLKLQNNQDKSKYLRVLTGYYTKNSTFNAFAGIKDTQIYSEITLDTIEKLKEQYTQLNNIATKYDLGLDTQTNDINDIDKHLNRKEKMYFVGCNYTLESKNFIYEVGFEYDKFKREKGLDYVDYNIVLDGTLSYKFTRNMLLYSSAKIMYRQLNGQIPYLYNEYTQTSYDHKYGYTKFGVQYRF